MRLRRLHAGRECNANRTISTWYCLKLAFSEPSPREQKKKTFAGGWNSRKNPPGRSTGNRNIFKVGLSTSLLNSHLDSASSSTRKITFHLFLVQRCSSLMTFLFSKARTLTLKDSSQKKTFTHPLIQNRIHALSYTGGVFLLTSRVNRLHELFHFWLTRSETEVKQKWNKSLFSPNERTQGNGLFPLLPTPLS